MSEEDGFQSERKRIKLIQDRLSKINASSLEFEKQLLVLRQRLPLLDELLKAEEQAKELGDMEGLIAKQIALIKRAE